MKANALTQALNDRKAFPKERLRSLLVIALLFEGIGEYYQEYSIIRGATDFLSVLGRPTEMHALQTFKNHVHLLQFQVNDFLLFKILLLRSFSKRDCFLKN